LALKIAIAGFISSSIAVAREEVIVAPILNRRSSADKSN
jgi:hypothetical protein